MTPALWLFSGWFSLAFVLVVVVMPLARRLAHWTGVVARPKADRWHRTVIPMLGGFGIWIAVALPLSVANETTTTTLWVLGVGSAMFVLGLVDDFLHLRPGVKLLGQIAVACTMVAAGPSTAWLGWPVVDALISILWFVGLTNAFNLLDNMDGLCAGVAAIAAMALALSGGPSAGPVFACAALVAGASCGFLVFNFNPASVFMGDSGSLFLGSTLAVLGLLGEHHEQGRVASTIAVPLAVMLIPIFDTTFVTLSRKLSGRPASTGGRDHTSHRLVALGFSERQAVLVLYALAAAGGCVGVAIAQVDPSAFILGGGVVIVLVLLGVRLARVAVYDGNDYVLLREGRITPLIIDFTYKRRVFEVLLDIVLITLAYYTAYLLRFDKDMPVYYPLLVRSVPLVIGCHIAGFFLAGVYRGVWRYITFADLPSYARGLGYGSAGSLLTLLYLYRFDEYSRSVFVLNAILLGIFVVGSRVFFRGIGELAAQRGHGQRPTLIIGAGDGGGLLLRELRSNASYDAAVLGFVDDDPAKRISRILGMPVLGSCADLPDLIVRLKVEVVMLSTAKLSPDRLEVLREICAVSGTELLQFGVHFQPLTSKVGRVATSRHFPSNS